MTRRWGAWFVLAVLTSCAVVAGSSFDRGPEDDVRMVDASVLDAQPSTTVTTAVMLDPIPVTVALRSTAYCLTSSMANGQHPYIGAVAANRWKIGTRLKVDDSPIGPGTFTVTDRHAPGATQLDFAIPGQCDLALRWGRTTVHVEVLP